LRSATSGGLQLDSAVKRNDVLSRVPKEPTDDELATFVAASIPSIWALECLLLLKRLAPVAKSRAEIVATLRSSELAIAQALERLEKAGLISPSEGTHVFSPATPLLSVLVDRVEQLYTRRPIWLMNIVLRAKHDSLQVFADSFRLKE
jgi:hypothetical protein